MCTCTLVRLRDKWSWESPRRPQRRCRYSKGSNNGRGQWAQKIPPISLFVGFMASWYGKDICNWAWECQKQTLSYFYHPGDRLLYGPSNGKYPSSNACSDPDCFLNQRTALSALGYFAESCTLWTLLVVLNYQALRQYITALSRKIRTRTIVIVKKGMFVFGWRINEARSCCTHRKKRRSVR